jgi:hypothetical protein
MSATERFLHDALPDVPGRAEYYDPHDWLRWC